MPVSNVALCFYVNFELAMLTLRCVTTYAAQRMQALRCIVNQPLVFIFSE